jgi:hypothetical protein
MKRLAILLLAACSSTPKNDAPPDAQADLVLAAQLLFDLSQVNYGQWARYTIRQEGNPNPEVVKYAAVGGDADGIWIENKVPAQPRPFIIKSKYSWKGELLEQWVGEPGSPKPAKIFPSKSAGPAKKGEEPKTRTTIEDDFVTLAGKTYRCSKITTTLAYSNRTSTLINWCSPDVPFSVMAEGKSHGGVVRRVFGKFTMELAAHGEDAKPELEIPK